MKQQSASLLLVAGVLALASEVQAATFSGHYPSGSEGIKAASLPPPGFYLRDYNMFYYADRFPGGPPDFRALAYINAPRAIYMTDFNILGANYGLDLLIPFYYGDVRFNTPAGRVSDSTWAMGDLQFAPLLLGWHFDQFDIGAGYAFWAPTGDYDRHGTRPSRLLAKGFWSHMLTAGATWYPDQAKTWSVSALNRYEIHMEGRRTDPGTGQEFKFTPGDTYTLEMGIAKGLTKTIEVGLAGYYQQQVTHHSPRGPRDQVVALGPEISTVCPKLGLFTSLRYLHEFAAHQRPEGHTVTLTLTKRW
jgi:hypothetical protein